LSSHGYTLDSAGNRTVLDEFVSGITTPGGNDHFTDSYDGLNRLTGVTGPVAESFTLDAASNLASRTGPTATYAYDTANRLLSDGAQSFTWNAADRLSQRGRDTFTFDALGRMTASQIVDDATLSGATWSTSDVPNSSAASLSFNGTTAYAEAPHTPVLNVTSDWTIEAWFKDATAGGYNHNDTFILMKGDSNVDGEAPYFLKIDHKLLSAGVRTNWTSYRVTYDLFAGGVSANAWHHAAATFVASTRQITLYVDGVQKAQGTVSVSSAIGSAKPLSIGRNGTTGYNWNGKLDDIRVWNVVRTATQISTSYQTELTGSPTGLVANWKLNDGSGTVATDLGVARSYTYNGDGLLKSRSEAGVTTQLLWDVASAPASLLVAGADRIVHGLGPMYIVRGDGSTRTLALDGLGSVRAELSDAGAVLSSFRYTAYGKTVTKPVTPTLLGYAAELSEASGLLYLRARWYDPAVGRFVTRDPLDGDSVYPLSLNVFAYARANPIRFVDPRGLDPADAFAKAVVEDTATIAAAFFARGIPDTGLSWRFEVVVMRNFAISELIGPEVIRPAAKVALEAAPRMGLFAGLAQGVVDLFRPELTLSQRLGRAAVAALVGVAAVAVATAFVATLPISGTVAVAATLLLATGIGFGLDEVIVKPRVYPALNFGR